MSTESQPSEETKRELLKVMLEGQRDLQRTFVQATSLYLLVVGGLLKFGVEATDTTVRASLLVAGAILSFGGVSCTRHGHAARQHYDKQIQRLNVSLGLPLSSTPGPALTSALKIVAGTCWIACVGFVLLLLHTIYKGLASAG